MASATEAILITLDPTHEGGYQCVHGDRANWTGGQVGVGELVGTNGGITALDMPGADIKNLTTDQKVDYYSKNYWKSLYSQISSQPVANKLFDMGVLFGVGTAVKALQRALGIDDDGLFGPNTLAMTNAANEDSLLFNFRKEMHDHATSVAAANPSEAAFLPDWSRRIDS